VTRTQKKNIRIDEKIHMEFGSTIFVCAKYNRKAILPSRKRQRKEQKSVSFFINSHRILLLSGAFFRHDEPEMRKSY